MAVLGVMSCRSVETRAVLRRILKLYFQVNDVGINDPEEPEKSFRWGQARFAVLTASLERFAVVDDTGAAWNEGCRRSSVRFQRWESRRSDR